MKKNLFLLTCSGGFTNPTERAEIATIIDAMASKSRETNE